MLLLIAYVSYIFKQMKSTIFIMERH